MKKVISEEVLQWTCDATKTEIKDSNGIYESPSCQVNFNFGYGSDLDGFELQLDFNDDIAKDIIDMLCDKYTNVAKIVEDIKKRI